MTTEFVTAYKTVLVRALVVPVAVIALISAVACGSNARSVLTAGYQRGLAEHGSPSPSNRDARRIGHQILADWRHEIARRAAASPTEPFRNLPPGVFFARLRTAAREDRFRIVSAKLLRPRQAAPEVIVATRHYLALAGKVRAIEAELDPHTGRVDSAGWAYEGFFFEAEDERGTPFLAVFNYMRADSRGDGKGGGQWARSESLYPFAHG